MTRQEVLQLHNNINFYIWDLISYFLEDDFDIRDKGKDGADAYQNLKDCLEKIDSAVAFILKDMKCDIIPKRKVGNE